MSLFVTIEVTSVSSAVKMEVKTVKNRVAVHDVYYSARFFFYVLKFLGFAPYKFDQKSLKFEMKARQYFLLICSIIAWIGLIWRQHISFEKTRVESGVESYFLDSLWQYQYLIQHYIAIIAIIFNFCKRKRVESFMKLIKKFDQSIKKLCWGFEVKHSRFFFLNFFLVSMFSILIYTIISLKPLKEFYFITVVMMTTMYATVNQFYFIISMQFILSTYCVYARLKALKNNVR